MKICLTGGGTAGSVSPLLAVYHLIKKTEPDSEFVFIGTEKGEPEMQMLRGYGMTFIGIKCGKLRRYVDWKNIRDLFLIGYGFFQAISVLRQQKPDVIMAAGAYVSVPVIWAGKLLGIPSIIHQQDVRPSLSNVLTRNAAQKITVTFERSLRNFPSTKTIWTGNPVRPDILLGDAARARHVFSLKKTLPVVLVVGGGTGSRTINSMVNQALPELVTQAHIIHSTGKGKRVSGHDHPHYHQYEFISQDMADALAVADVVVSRAGLSAITEFCALQKPAILIPLPGTHQEDNAAYLEQKNAAIVIAEHNLSPHFLAGKIKFLLDDEDANAMLQSNIGNIMKFDAAQTIAQIILRLHHEA